MLTFFSASFFPAVPSKVASFVTVEAFSISPVAFLSGVESGIIGLLFRGSRLKLAQIVEFDCVCTDIMCGKRSVIDPCSSR